VGRTVTAPSLNKPPASCRPLPPETSVDSEANPQLSGWVSARSPADPAQGGVEIARQSGALPCNYWDGYGSTASDAINEPALHRMGQ
jgi:hypothetical protein